MKLKCPAGLEPATSSLATRRSANRTPSTGCGERESNPRDRIHSPAPVPLGHRHHDQHSNLANMMGLAPTFSGVTGRRLDCFDLMSVVRPEGLEPPKWLGVGQLPLPLGDGRMDGAPGNRTLICRVQADRPPVEREPQKEKPPGQVSGPGALSALFSSRYRADHPPASTPAACAVVPVCTVKSSMVVSYHGRGYRGASPRGEIRTPSRLVRSQPLFR